MKCAWNCSLNVYANQPHQLKMLSLRMLPMRVCLSVNETATPQLNIPLLETQIQNISERSRTKPESVFTLSQLPVCIPSPLSSVPSPSLFLRKKLFCIPCFVFLSYCLKLTCIACMEYNEDIICEWLEWGNHLFHLGSLLCDFSFWDN